MRGVRYYVMYIIKREESYEVRVCCDGKLLKTRLYIGV